MATNVIIGGGSSIAAAISRRLDPASPLIVTVRDLTRGRPDGIPAHAELVKCDLSSPTEVEALTDQVDTLGSLVVVAAMSPRMGTAAEIYEVNLVAVARLVETLVSKVVPGTAGVLISSIAGHAAHPSPAMIAELDAPSTLDLLGRLASAGVDITDATQAYGLSKFGVMRLARNQSLAWGRQGGRLLSLSPGIIDTPMSRLESKDVPAELLQQVMDGWPVPRRGQPEEIADVVEYLLSDKATYMTGSDVLVDGGALGRTPGTN